MSTTTIESAVQVLYDVDLEGVHPDDRSTVGAALAESFEPLPETMERVSLWFSEEEYADLNMREAARQAERRALKLLAKRQSIKGLRLLADESTTYRVRERLIQVEVTRNDDGRIISRKAVRS